MKIKFTIKNKIFNHLTKNGEKEISENILIKTTKNLQKNSKKNSKNIILTSIFFNAPTFKIFSYTRKKRKKKTVREVPVFLLDKNQQFSFGIKNFLEELKKKKFVSENLKTEFLLGAKNINDALKIKNKIYDTAISKKNLMRYYKW